MYGSLWWRGIPPGTSAELDADANLHLGSNLLTDFPWGGDPLTGQLPKTWGIYRKIYASDYKKKSPKLLAASFLSPGATTAAMPPP